MAAPVEQLRELLTAELPDRWVKAVQDEDLATVEEMAGSAAALHARTVVAENGWLTPDWPAEYGGRGLTSSDALAVRRELYRWQIGLVLSAIGSGWIGPTILKYGSPELKAMLLPPIARDQHMWCQLFSEPDAGSDLASVRTTAVRDGDHWVLKGTKIWTSRADTASYGFALVRTDGSVPKHAGLTCFCVDMHAPGVSISPIKQMTGDSEFFETRLDSVSVPDLMRVGEPGQGWDVVRTVLGFERLAGSGVGAAPPGSVVGRSSEELLERWQGKLDAVTADRLVETWLEGRLIEMNNRRTSAERQSGKPSTAAGTPFNKVLQAEHTKRLQQLVIDLDGLTAIAYDADPDWYGENLWAMLRVQAKTIAGGTSEVLRNQIAERGLKLPRDRDPSKTMAWNDFIRSVERPAE